MKIEIKEIGKNVIDLQIKALKKLKYSLDGSFNKAVKEILKCKSKVVLCGVGKSQIISEKVSATLASVGTPSFPISANEASHGGMGRLSSKDILILMIYKASNIKLLIPEVIESGDGIVPTSSTTTQLAIGDALSIALMKKRKFTKLDFKAVHPAGNLSKKLKTAKDLMLTKGKIPFVNEKYTMKKALKILNLKRLGFVVVINNKGLTLGVFTDGDLKRILQKKRKIDNFEIKSFMTSNPYTVEENTLGTEILSQMNKRKITSVCVYKKQNKKKTIGVIHIHNLLKVLK